MKLNNLSEYEQKKVRVETADGIFEGIVVVYCSAEENIEENEECIGLAETNNEHRGLLFYKSDIRNIELLA